MNPLDITKGGLKFSSQTQSQTQKGRSKGPWINCLLLSFKARRLGSIRSQDRIQD
jgi:hypothetical protein